MHCTETNRVLFRERGAVRLVVHPLDNRSRARRLLFRHLRLASHLRLGGTDVLFAPGNALPLRVPCRSVLGIQSLHSFVVPEEFSLISRSVSHSQRANIAFRRTSPLSL